MRETMQGSLFPGGIHRLRQSSGTRRTTGGGTCWCNWRRWKWWNKGSIIFTIIVICNIRTTGIHGYWVNWLNLVTKWMNTRISSCHWLPGTGLATITITAFTAGAKVTDKINLGFRTYRFRYRYRAGRAKTGCDFPSGCLSKSGFGI